MIEIERIQIIVVKSCIIYFPYLILYKDPVSKLEEQVFKKALPKQASNKPHKSVLDFDRDTENKQNKGLEFGQSTVH